MEEEKQGSPDGGGAFSNPPEVVPTMISASPLLKPVGFSLDSHGGGSGGRVGGNGEISFDEIDLKDPSPSYSPLSSPPPAPGSAPSGLSLNYSDAPKRRRGRPPGSRNREKRTPPLGELLAGTAGDSFTPYFTTVKTGEDVLTKVLSFPLNGGQGVCVLSATGSVSNVTIRPPGVHVGNSFTYEGLFEILSLTGSFVAAEPKGKSRTGGLTVSIAGANGRVIGGAVAGTLMAASPIQMVLGSFVTQATTTKPQKRKYTKRAPQLTSGGNITSVTTTTATTTPTGGHPDAVQVPVSHGMASGSPVDPSGEDIEEEDDTTSEGAAAKDMQNLNIKPCVASGHDGRNGSERVSINSAWRDDINVYPAAQL